MSDLQGKAAIVTGGARGIGLATARALHKAGAAVLIADVAEELAVHEANALGDRALGLGVDVTDARSVDMMVETALEKFDHVDILVNSAGICRRGRAQDIPESEWDLVVNVNLKGAFLCSKAVLPSMIRQGWGRIVNIASIAGKIGGLMVGVHYAASKGGLLALTKGLAREVALQGITVNAVCPALTNTDMSALFSAEELENYCRSVPIGRLASAEEVAAGILYLCSEEAAYVTGEVLDINGGVVMD